MAPVVAMAAEDFKIKIGPNFLISFEKTRIIAARALQIYLGAPVLIPQENLPPNTSPIDIAEIELKRKLLPLAVRRVLPNGEMQDIPIQYLEIRD